jgi:hypothetical protein
MTTDRMRTTATVRLVNNASVPLARIMGTDAIHCSSLRRIDKKAARLWRMRGPATVRPLGEPRTCFCRLLCYRLLIGSVTCAISSGACTGPCLGFGCTSLPGPSAPACQPARNNITSTVLQSATPQPSRPRPGLQEQMSAAPTFQIPCTALDDLGTNRLLSCQERLRRSHSDCVMRPRELISAKLEARVQRGYRSLPLP